MGVEAEVDGVLESVGSQLCGVVARSALARSASSLWSALPFAPWPTPTLKDQRATRLRT